MAPITVVVLASFSPAQLHSRTQTVFASRVCTLVLFILFIFITRVLQKGKKKPGRGTEKSGIVPEIPGRLGHMHFHVCFGLVSRSQTLSRGEKESGYARLALAVVAVLSTH